MSLHTSFKVGRSMKRHRSVLSRLERIKILSQGKAFDPVASSVLGLPKVKHLKIKVKKTKSAGPAEGEAAAGGAAATSGATAAKGGAAKAGGAAAKPSAAAAKTAAASTGGQVGRKTAPSGK